MVNGQPLKGVIIIILIMKLTNMG